MTLIFESTFLEIVLLCIVSFISFCYLWFRRRYTHWTKKGVVNSTPSIPLGHMGPVVFNIRHIGQLFADVYTKYKDRSVSGIYMLHRPTLVVNDLELIRTMMVKDFIHFSDHGFIYDEKAEPIGGHLFNLTGEKWKKLRVKLTPTFTSTKIKNMFQIVNNCAGEMTSYLCDPLIVKEVWNVKELMTRLNTDIIGNCAFGISCNSFKNPNTEFLTMGRRVFEPNFLENIVNTLDFFIPYVFAKVRLAVIGTELQDFFYKLVEDTIKYREKEKIERNDFLQLLIELKHSNTLNGDEDTSGKESQQDDGTRLTTMQIAAQVFVFFIAGFETSSTTASFALYELALNPDIQVTLRKEIDEVLEKHKGEVTYDALGEMNYLGLVIDETLRKYPPLPVLFRICTKDYIIPDTDIKIEKDTPVMVPIMGIQRDPDIYPDPMKFDPTRFTPENKASRHHFSYMPFGEGPRICIGSRFGLMQTKLGLVSILSKYEVSPCEKTLIPMKYDNRSFILSAEGGVWLKLTPRTNKKTS